jgi:sialidase-1
MQLRSTLLPGFVFGPVSLVASVASGQVTFPDLIHHWPAEGSAADVVGAADGTLNGAVGYVAGRFGQAFDFDSGEFITFGNSTCNFGFEDFTLSFWIRLDAPGQMALFTKRPLCVLNQMIDLRVLASGDVNVEFSGPQASGYTSLQAPGMLGDGEWHHVAWSRSLQTLEIHIDGCLAATEDSLVPIIFSNSAPFMAGKGPCTGSPDGTVPFDGALDEIQVYMRALDDAEIAALAERPAGSPDLDCSGAIDGADLGFLLGAWGPCKGFCAADLNGDGVVDGADIGVLLGGWE